MNMKFLVRVDVNRITAVTRGDLSNRALLTAERGA
jgi:hypothetical protein